MKRLLTLFLALIMFIGLLIGCAGETDNAVDPSTSPKISSDTDKETNKPRGIAVLDGGEFKLPIVDDGVEYTIWNAWNVATSNMISNNDSFAYQEMEKRTNVHIEWHHPASGLAAESFNLSIASNDFDDAYMLVSTYMTQGPDFFVENDIFIDIEPYISEYAPNYDYVRRHHDVVKETVTDSGYAVGFWQIAKTMQWYYFGPLGRTDWLDDLGMEMPTTIDQLHDVLVAFRDSYNPDCPMSLGINGLDAWLIAAFDTIYSTDTGAPVFLQVDGEVRFGATEPGFREYTQLIQNWYSERLIDQEFYAREKNPSLDTAFILNDKVGLGSSLYTYPEYISNLVANDPENNPKLKFEGFAIPARGEGEHRKILVGSASINNMKRIVNTISSQCKNPEVLMRWFDYLYTEEGSLLANYGIENLSYVLDSDGVPKTTELIYNNPDGIALNNVLPLYAMNQYQASWYDWERELSPVVNPAVLETKELWDGNWKDEYSIPYTSLTLTSEESTEYASIMTDVNTYLEENLIKFFTNQRSMDEYESMLEQVKSMDIARATEIMQAAYDRYLTRGNK
jgi:putative aldouronate transport system substrate-binding protein